MLWRRIWILPRSIPVLRLLHTAVSKSPAPCHPLLPRRAKPTITPQLVNSTLSSFQSDLIALRFFLWCATLPDYFHDRHAYLRMVDVLGRTTDRCRSVKGVLEELKSIGSATKAQTFLILLRIYWVGGRCELVLETFKEMEDFGYTPNTFARNIVMDVYFKLGRVDLALNALRENEQQNFLTFNTALGNFCRVNDLGNVGDVTRIMLEKGFYPNIETFGEIFSCFCKSGRLLETLPLLGLMIKVGLSISLNIWSILIDGYCRLNRTDIAEILLRKMVQSGCSPNVITYTSLIKRFMENRMVGKAYRILKIIGSTDVDVDLVFYNVLIDSLSKNAFHKDALILYCTLLEKGLVPDGYTLSAVLSTLCSSRIFCLSPKGLKRLILEEDLDIVACNSLLRYLFRAQLPPLAKLLYNQMIIRELVPDCYTFAELLGGYCASGQFGEAIDLYNKLVKSHQNLDPHVHTAIISGHVKAGKYRQAVALFRKAQKGNDLDAKSYTVAIHGLFMDGRGVEAFALFTQMKEIGINPNFHTYNVLVSGFCREKDRKMVAKLLQEMVKARVMLQHSNFLRICNFVCSTVSNLLDEMEGQGLLVAKTIFLRRVHTRDTDTSFIGHTLENSSTDISSSEDLCDVAASVG